MKFSDADKAAWRWREYDRCLRIARAVTAKHDLDPGLLRPLEDAIEDDDSEAVLDALFDIVEVAMEPRDEGTE